ncbi:hypothetical protein [Hyalangium rubrum]|uniref:Uncharacterized protein n=1 Tax=Hyalangium rubrum TaxID=3103134 RepID=A0ABU5HG88_9BACT|nr:hypothetical protein [Hyalangium sp. s54d21]MDY7232177.1 hypothetical protein [Hyalangium sp. s54d21]
MSNDILAAPEPAPTETPWALAQRLVEQGLPAPTVRERLLQAGLPDEDVTTLLRALRLKSVAGPGERRGPAQEPSELGVLVGVVKAGLAANTFLATGETGAGKQALRDLMQVTHGFMGAELVDAPVVLEPMKGAPSAQTAPEAAAFEVADGTPRCRVHPQLPSIGTCPRCGALACYTCAPKKGFSTTGFCAACERHPAVHEDRVRKAARLLGMAVGLEAALLLALMLFAPLLDTFQRSWELPMAFEVALSLPFVALGLAQGLVRHPWPGAAGVILSGGLMLATLFTAQGEVPAELLLLLIAPMAVMLFALERLTTRRKDWREVSGMKAT